MKPNFCKERRELLKSTCALAGATALVSVGGSLNAFAAGGAMPQLQAHGVPEVGDTFVFSDGPNKGKDVFLTDVVADAAPITVQAKDPATGKVRGDISGDNATVLLYRVAPEKISDEMKVDTVDGVMAYSAVCTHLGCMLSNWDAPTKQFLCPCHDALFDPLKSGANTGGATCRPLPYIPLKVAGVVPEITDIDVDDIFVFADGSRKGKIVFRTDLVADAAPITVQAKDPATGKLRGYPSTILVRRVAPEEVPEGMNGDTVDGVMAYNEGANTSGTLPHVPLKVVEVVPEVGDLFVFTGGPHKGKVVLPADVVADAAPIKVQAMDPATGKVREYDGDSDCFTVLLRRVAPEKVPDEMKGDTVDGVMAYSQGANTGGATSPTLPHIPLKVADGKLAVAGNPSGYVGVKNGKLVVAGEPIGYADAQNGQLVVAGKPSGYVGVKRG